MKTPKAPPPPDPIATSRAQTASNVATSVANTRLSNADEVGPLGSVRYEVIDWEEVGDGLGGKNRVPRYRRIEELSPEQMGLLRQEQEFDRKTNDLAIGQVDRLQGVLSHPINLDGLPDAPGDQEEYRSKVENAMFQRLNPQLQRDREALETQLVNQGLVRGSEAFNRAADEYGRQANDARTNVLLASGAEAREQGAFQAANRERALQERLTLRNQPINEISALVNGGQVVLPQFTPYRPAPMSETPHGQHVYSSAQLAQDAWKARVAAQQTQMGNIFGLMGNVFRLSDRRLKRDIERIGALPSGLPVYSYRYLWSDGYGVGVMAQEALQFAPEAVVAVGPWLAVDYRKVR